MLDSLPPEWMPWTVGTLAFLGTIILVLIGLTVWDMYDPGWARRGSILPIETTRGDRFFIGLLLTGIIFCLWLVFVGPTAVWGVLVVGGLAIIGSISFL
jgi:predicted small integral membrane protein